MEIAVPDRFATQLRWGWLHRPPFVRALQGLILGIGSPLGWLLIQLASPHPIRSSFGGNWGVYLYMLIGTCVVFAAFGFYAGLQQEYVMALATHDDLTGLYNCRHFWERLAGELRAADLRTTGISILLINVDHFTEINEDYGHVFGNQILTYVGEALRTTAHTGETVARIAGDEFCVILPDCGPRAAYLAALRYQAAIQHIEVKMFGVERVPVTASIGVASRLPGEGMPAGDLLHHADLALRVAKSNGRDRIEPEQLSGL